MEEAAGGLEGREWTEAESRGWTEGGTGRHQRADGLD